MYITYVYLFHLSNIALFQSFFISPIFGTSQNEGAFSLFSLSCVLFLSALPHVQSEPVLPKDRFDMRLLFRLEYLKN